MKVGAVLGVNVRVRFTCEPAEAEPPRWLRLNPSQRTLVVTVVNRTRPRKQPVVVVALIVVSLSVVAS